MADLKIKEQKKFLRFCTGSPRLPFGGFRNMEPKLTLVKKET